MPFHKSTEVGHTNIVNQAEFKHFLPFRLRDVSKDYPAQLTCGGQEWFFFFCPLLHDLLINTIRANNRKCWIILMCVLLWLFQQSGCLLLLPDSSQSYNRDVLSVTRLVLLVSRVSWDLILGDSRHTLVANQWWGRVKQSRAFTFRRI